MADPHHVPELDAFDRVTVTLYRTGLALTAVGLATLTAAALHQGPPAWLAMVLVLAGTSLSVANLHLYDKRIRWVIHAAGWVGALLLVLSASLLDDARHVLGHAGLGFLFVSLSGLALKEQFCFKVPFLRLVPVTLAASLVPLVLGWELASAVLLGLSSLGFAVLAVVKARMPLHYDIGNKSAYQV